jgi:hypothetical protein
MLGYQSTWVLQTAIVALGDRSLEYAGGRPHAASMRIITVNAADAPQRFDKMERCQDRYGHATGGLKVERILQLLRSNLLPVEHVPNRVWESRMWAHKIALFDVS